MPQFVLSRVELYAVGVRVVYQCQGFGEGGNGPLLEHSGVVIGHSVVQRPGEGASLVHVVQLDKPFWSEGREVCFATLAVHADSLKLEIPELQAWGVYIHGGPVVSWTPVKGQDRNVRWADSFTDELIDELGDDGHDTIRTEILADLQRGLVKGTAGTKTMGRFKWELMSQSAYELACAAKVAEPSKEGGARAK